MEAETLVPVSLNPNELLLPPPFQNRAVPFQLVPDKNIYFVSDYQVYRTEIMHFKPQGSQVSRIHRETHAFQPVHTLSRHT